MEPQKLQLKGQFFLKPGIKSVNVMPTESLAEIVLKQEDSYFSIVAPSHFCIEIHKDDRGLVETINSKEGGGFAKCRYKFNIVKFIRYEISEDGK